MIVRMQRGEQKFDVRGDGLPDDVGSHHAQLRQITGRPQQNHLQTLEYQRQLPNTQHTIHHLCQTAFFVEREELMLAGLYGSLKKIIAVFYHTNLTFLSLYLEF